MSALETHPSVSAMRRRVIAIVLLAWLPLLLLSALDGKAWGGVDAAFLTDLEVHVRFLLAVPLLLLAEGVVRRRLAPLLQQFLVRRLLPEESIPRFEAAVAAASRRRDSKLAQAVLLVIVYGVGIGVVWRHYGVLDAATWYATPSAEGRTLTPAGLWHAGVSLPIVQFLLLRWYWRMAVWARLLWQISRIPLRLLPAHPDRFGGLGFLASVGYAYTLLAAAHGALAAGPIASRIFLAGATLTDFGSQIAGIVLLVLCLVLGPLLCFTPQLAAAKQAGLLAYGALAERHVRGFEAKWLRAAAPADGDLLGSPDVSSQADLGTSCEVVRNMNITPLSSHVVLPLTMATLAPILPLVLTLIPLNELLKKLLGIGL
jgi:hypothetical protein